MLPDGRMELIARAHMTWDRVRITGFAHPNVPLPDFFEVRRIERLATREAPPGVVCVRLESTKSKTSALDMNHARGDESRPRRLLPRQSADGPRKREVAIMRPGRAVDSRKVDSARSGRSE